MRPRQTLILILMLSMLVQAACAHSASACPTATSDTKLLVNTQDGYCLLYPAEDVSNMPGWVVINPISGAGDAPGDAWLNIQVQDAAGRTVTQFADEIMATTDPGFNINIEDVQVDGNPAIVVDGLPGLDSNRLVMIVHNDRLYTLTFLPWRPNESQPTPLENLYTMVMDTLRFLPQE
jgi:hypothetical protein